MTRNLIVLLLVTLFIGPIPTLADETEVIELTVSAAPRPEDVLRYRFAPRFGELSEGNAAALYYRAIVELQGAAVAGVDVRQGMNQVSAWLELPPDELPIDEAKRQIDRHRRELKEIHIGARRRDAHWDIPLDEEGAMTLLTEVQEIRNLARLLALETRVAVLEGDYEAASTSLETLMTMGRHVGESGSLISMFVGLAVYNLSLREIEHWVDQPDSPNTYWALTRLPGPVGDLPAVLETENRMIAGTFPALEQLETSILSKPQAEELTTILQEMISMDASASALPAELSIVSLGLRVYPVAKRQLIESGLDVGLVEAMPVTQVILLRGLRAYRDYLEEMTLWSARPYREARPALEEIDRRMKSLVDEPESFLMATMLPAVGTVMESVARTEQRIAMLRVVEALRLHAAAHDGKLPAELADVTAVPLPFDPTVDRPFRYRLDGNTAILESAGHGILRREVAYKVQVEQ